MITLARHDDGSLAGAVCYVPSDPRRTAHVPWLVPGGDGDTVPPLLRRAQFTQFDWLFSYAGPGSDLHPRAALSHTGRTPHGRWDT